MLRICIGLRRKGNILPQQSLSHAVRVTAQRKALPSVAFTQGSLGRSRARGFIDSLSRYPNRVSAPECRKSNFKRRSLPICTAPKPPLCKGRWGGVSRLGGIVQWNVTNLHWTSAKRKHFTATIPQSRCSRDSSAQGTPFGRLYTREPWAL